ncbi:DNA/RNA non-specific endonuclease [Sphingomonas sp. TX0543]|uniref:DNA/RNA non-specific endonuclease n=1 Tax=unclassified Sphingomonas TaxID=196159 RepID=UPI0010F54AD6|nr:DNA/RNA non-specific endonuclease [Sphingomonas sp. 3P27F8]
MEVRVLFWAPLPVKDGHRALEARDAAGDAVRQRRSRTIDENLVRRDGDVGYQHSQVSGPQGRIVVNGPTEAFNHFAQDANFNRGGYRLLEDEWARDKRAGRAVTVKIVPQVSSASVRPSTINVWWTVDGKTKSLRFPNERPEKRRGGN